jgi:motility quorum-sensing regulator/GCU-specific mRNA interferase toxin
MEKPTPHYKLTDIKALVAARKVRSTRTADNGATELGMNTRAMLLVVTALKSSDFDKSMTTYADHTAWQDVYKPVVGGVELYVKLMVDNDAVIVSFKRSTL